MKILGYDYTVEDMGRSAAFGATTCGLQQIRVRLDLAPQAIESTLLHEIIEALNYHLSLDLEHRTIMALEASLYQTLVDNGVSFKPLVESLK